MENYINKNTVNDITYQSELILDILLLTSHFKMSRVNSPRQRRSSLKEVQ